MKIGDCVELKKRDLYDVVRLVRMDDAVYAIGCTGDCIGKVNTRDDNYLERFKADLFGRWEIINRGSDNV